MIVEEFDVPEMDFFIQTPTAWAFFIRVQANFERRFHHI